MALKKSDWSHLRRVHTEHRHNITVKTVEYVILGLFEAIFSQYELLNPSCFHGLVSSNLPLFALYWIMASFSAARAFPSYDKI